MNFAKTGIFLELLVFVFSKDLVSVSLKWTWNEFKLIFSSFHQYERFTRVACNSSGTTCTNVLCNIKLANRYQIMLNFWQEIKCINATMPKDAKAEKSKLWPQSPNGWYKMTFTVSDASDDNIFKVTMNLITTWTFLENSANC
jgi:hypothetical protein